MTALASTKASNENTTEKATEYSKEQLHQPSPTSPSADILALQETAGNRAVSQSLATNDGVSSATVIQRKPATDEGICPTCGRRGRGTCPGCGQEFVPVQRQETSNGASPDGGLSQVQAALNAGGGHPLDSGTRTLMESRFNHDFSQVRIHTNNQAAASARAINAQAYTIGRDIAFASGQYNPKNAEGQSLLAHELAHVIQQKYVTSSRPMLNPKMRVGTTTSSFEAEADRASEAIATNSPIQVSQRLSAPYIQRARWGRCPPGRRLSARRRPDRYGAAELFALVIYRTARAGNLVISNVDLLEDIPARGRHGRMLRAMQERFRSLGRPSPIRRTERVGDIPDIPTYPGQGSLEPIQEQRPQLEEAAQNLLRPDIIDMDQREVYDVTSIGSAQTKVQTITSNLNLGRKSNFRW